jgi:salicylate hydroxylase
VPSERPILVVGGGIAGLTLAISLARHGRQAIVLENRARFETEGAGLQLGANGVRVLQRLGVADRLRARVGEPGVLAVFAGRSGRRLGELPLGAWFARRYGAPYWTMHRSDLHAALVEAARAEPRLHLRAGYALSSFSQDTSCVELLDGAGDRLLGGALVGADGLWSAVRQGLWPASRPRFAGVSAARAVLPAQTAARLAGGEVGLWLGAGANVVYYPVRAGQEIAIVVIARLAGPAAASASSGDPVETASVLARLTHFHPELTEILARAPQWRQWPLHVLPQLPNWSLGRIGVIGDAAHPMLPHLAQGGALALEDGLLLGALLGDAARPVAQSLRGFALERRQRARLVARRSRRNGTLYHLAPPLAVLRDAALRLVPGAWLMAGYDWLYGWRPD